MTKISKICVIRGDEVSCPNGEFDFSLRQHLRML